MNQIKQENIIVKQNIEQVKSVKQKITKKQLFCMNL